VAGGDGTRALLGLRPLPVVVQVDRPPLDASDELLRRLAAGLSERPRWAAWLATDDAIRRFVASVVRVSAGSSPADRLEFMEPDGRFQVRDSDGEMVIMPIDRDWLTARTWYPDRNPAAWSSSGSCGQLPVTMLRDAMSQENYEVVRELVKRVTETQETFFPDGSREQFYMYNVPVEKIRYNAAGYINCGPSRRPYHNIPEEHAEGARIAGERWRELVAELEADDELQSALYGDERRTEAPAPAATP
jgi:hypothetical protein